MAWWRVKLHSEGWLLDVDGEVQTYGFYTTRCVEADGIEAAAEAGRADARWELEPMVRHEGDEPFMQAERIEELREPESRMGFVFYAAHDERSSREGDPVFRVVRTPLRSRMRRLWSLFRHEDR